MKSRRSFKAYYREKIFMQREPIKGLLRKEENQRNFLEKKKNLVKAFSATMSP